jgi:ABC-type multidrug transport system ATPase subunit
VDAAGPTADPAAQPPDGLQVAEALKLYSSFYRAPADWRALMDTLGLAGQSTTRFGRLSGGQKQRLSIALALVGSPQVTVLDELTTGLDPQARRDTWDLIEDVRSRGVTIVLVTHVMEEAERLCDRVALIDAGCGVAVDTPAALAGRVQAEQRIGFRAANGSDVSWPVRCPRRGPRRQRRSAALDPARRGYAEVRGPDGSPDDEEAGIGMAAAGYVRMRASTADRDRSIEVLKASFVEGRLTKDDFDLRLGQAFVSASSRN